MHTLITAFATVERRSDQSKLVLRQGTKIIHEVPLDNIEKQKRASIGLPLLVLESPAVLFI